MVISYCFPSCSHTHSILPPKPLNTSYLPLWRYLQTAADSCLAAPPSQCATHCHSASALQTASPVLCLSRRRGGRGFKIINYTKGNAVPLTPPTHQHRFYTVGDNRREENLHVWLCLHTTAHQFSQYRENRGGGGVKTQLLRNKNSSEELGVSEKCLEQR